MDLQTIILAVILLILLYFLWKSHRKYEQIFNGPKPWPILGNAFELFVQEHKVISVFENWSNRFGSIFQIWLGTNPYIFIADPNAAHDVLSSTIHLEKAKEYDLLDMFLGKGLSTLNGAEWYQRRRHLNTLFFTFKELEDFMVVFNEQSKLLCQKLSDNYASTKKTFNMYPYINECALRIICESALGCLNSDPNDLETYMKAVHEMCEIVIRRIMCPWLRPEWIWQLSSDGRKEHRIRNILRNFITKVIHQRRGHSLEKTCIVTKKKAFLDYLLQSNLTEEQIRDEVQTFIFGGHDTTASALSWTLYLIASDSTVQRKLNDELFQVFNDGDENRDVTLKDLRNLKYMENCIKEALRLYPSGPFYGRYLKTDLVLKESIKIPAGFTVFVAPIIMHKNPVYFKDPHEFKPERFENEEKFVPYSYIPFSAGPRNCIGQKFAIMEQKVFLANFFRRFYAETCEKEAKTVLELTLKPFNGPMLKIYNKHSSPNKNE